MGRRKGRSGGGLISILLGLLFRGKRKLKVKIILAFNCVILAVGLIWYACQPEARRSEVNHLVGAYIGNNRQISIGELAWDIWQLYYGDAVPCQYKAGEEPVFGGYPKRTDGTTLRLLKNKGYCVGYDEALRLPAWSAYRLFDCPEAEVPERPDEFMADKRTLAPVYSEDYTGSGFDRGHLAPNFAIARCFGADAQRETFLMSNIVPQRHAMNAGIWKSLEQKEAINYTGRFQEIWIVAGPVLGTVQRRLPSGILIPEQMFKIILDVREGNVRALAFLISQDAGNNVELAGCMCSIDEIERLTSLDFFPELSADVQNALEGKAAARVW